MGSVLITEVEHPGVVKRRKSLSGLEAMGGNCSEHKEHHLLPGVLCARMLTR